MTKVRVLALAAAFLASLALSSTGCLRDEQGCPETPPTPDAQEPLSGLEVAFYDEVGNLAEGSFQPESGTISVEGASVVVEYTEAGVTHEVRYVVSER